VGINSESDIAANLQIGPTDQGMVRLYVQGDGIDLPFDFDPEEAEEIAEEIRAAAAPSSAQNLGRAAHAAAMRRGGQISPSALCAGAPPAWPPAPSQ